jgi:hypothetical protein
MSFSEWFPPVAQILAAAASLVSIVSLPIAVAAYIRAKRKEQQDREYGTYNSLDERYTQFLNLAIQYPRLDLFEIGVENPPELTTEEKIQQLAAFAILFGILERAYLMYSDQETEIRRLQWLGWDTFIRRYASRASFKRAWSLVGDEMDSRFLAYMQPIAGVPGLSRNQRA